MAKARSGGGSTMNKNVKPPVRTGSPAKGTSPGASDYIGQTTAFKKEPVEARPAYNSGVPLGNAKALDKSQTVHRSGSQSQHGPVAPGHSPQRKDILSEYGPDKRRS